MEYTRSNISRIAFVAIGIMLGILLIGTLLAYIESLGIENNNQQNSANVVFPTTTPMPSVSITKTPDTHLANPASVNCSNKGGKTIIQKRADGGQYGLCDFGSGMICEEWAMYRGECPIGGIRTTGFDTVEQKYCVWSGGSTIAVENAVCTFHNGSTCPVDAYFNGACKPEN